MEEIKFTKYQTKGDYHWRLYEKSRAWRAHADFIKEWVKEKNVLDVGAGDGKITHLLDIVGIDTDPYGVAIAQEKGARVSIGSAYELDYDTESLDSILMIDSLEHFAEPERAIREARRVIKKYIYIVTPVRKDADKPGERVGEFHCQEWKPDELVELMKKEGFEAEGEIKITNKSMYIKFKKIL